MSVRAVCFWVMTFTEAFCCTSCWLMFLLLWFYLCVFFVVCFETMFLFNHNQTRTSQIFLLSPLWNHRTTHGKTTSETRKQVFTSTINQSNTQSINKSEVSYGEVNVFQFDGLDISGWTGGLLQWRWPLALMETEHTLLYALNHQVNYRMPFLQCCALLQLQLQFSF